MKNFVFMIIGITIFVNSNIYSQNIDPSPSNIIERLKSDLGRSGNIVLFENINAVSLRSQGFPDTIVSGRGGVFGSGQFYGYSWKLKNGIVDEVSYLQPFSEKNYQDAVNNYNSILGKGININGNGFGWLIPEKGGITIILINGSNNLIVHSSSMGYNDILVRLRNK